MAKFYSPRNYIQIPLSNSVHLPRKVKKQNNDIQIFVYFLPSGNEIHRLKSKIDLMQDTKYHPFTQLFNCNLRSSKDKKYIKIHK